MVLILPSLVILCIFLLFSQASLSSDSTIFNFSNSTARRRFIS